MSRHLRIVNLLVLLSLVLTAVAVSAEPLRIDPGAAALESGAPVPLGNRPLPLPLAPRARMTGRSAALAPAYVEPTEFGVILEYGGTRAELEAAGVRVNSQVGSTFTARVTRDRIGALRALPGLRALRLSRYLRPSLNVSAVDVRSDLEHAAVGTPPVYTGRAGQGIIIGDVDSGIDFTRPDFQDSTGKTRILYIWDQSDLVGPNPAGYTYGSEWTKAQIDDTPATVRQVDSDGHGTNVAGVLIGRGVETGCSQAAYRYVGMAPKAEFIEVKTDFSDAGIIDGVNYIFQKAAALGKDCVVNLSLGGQYGPHDGSDDFSSAISALAAPGHIVVASSGNDQADNIHGLLTTTSQTVGTDRFTLSLPSYTRNSGTFNDYFLVTGWYDPTASFTIRLKGPNASDTLSCGFGGGAARSTTSGKLWMANQNATLGAGGTATARQFEIEVYDSVASYSPRAGTWEIDVVANNAASLGKRADIWIYVAQLGAAGVVPVVVTGLNATTMVGNPADGDSTIAVGAHATKGSWYSCTQAGTYTFNPAPTVGAIAYFSNVGPRRDGVQKPDLTAPGYGVATTHSLQAGAIGTAWDVDDGVHEINAGTSFSAPHVSGAIALYLQAHPGASPAQVRAAFRAHARTDAYTGAVPNATWGYGKLDIYATLDHVAPTVALTAPAGGEDWKAGASHAITWTATDNEAVASVDLAYSTDGGATYPNAIASGIANSSSYAWSVPDVPTTTARVRVTARDAAGNTASAASAANFTLSRWTITASAGSGGTITPSGAVGVVDGGSRTFSIQPQPGWHVATLLVDGAPVTPDTSYTFTDVHADHTLAATFAGAELTLTAAVAAGHGAVSRAPDQPTYAYGTPVTVTATPDAGWAFSGWSGDTSGTANPVVLTLWTARAVAAAFADTAAPVVHVLAPVGGESFTFGDVAHLSWSATDNHLLVAQVVYLSRGGAAGPFDSLAAVPVGTTTYDWTVTGPVTTDALVRVVARDSSGNLGLARSDSVFAIADVNAVDDGPVTRLALAPVRPNPMRGTGIIAFALPRSADVRLSVLDVQGREVAVLVDGERPAGRHEVAWDARRGAAAPGLYFVRLALPGEVRMRRVAVTH
jgi:subtilisin family serine protease